MRTKAKYILSGFLSLSFLCISKISTTVEAQNLDSGLIWSIESDGQWIADNIELGEYGTQVFFTHGSFPNVTSLVSSHDSITPIPIWSHTAPHVTNYYRKTAASKHSNTYVMMRQESIQSGTTNRRAYVYKFTSGSPNPDWSREIPVTIAGHQYSDVAVSKDGQKIVTLVYDFSIGKTRVEVLGPDSSIPQAIYQLSTSGPWLSHKLSADGKKLLLTSQMRIVILNLETSQVELNHPLSGATNYGAISISESGNTVVFGTIGRILLFQETQSGNYTQLSPLIFDDISLYARRVELSNDGSILVTSLHKTIEPSLATIRTYDLSTPSSPIQATEYIMQGIGNLQNLGEKIDISDNGERFVVGLLGDEGDVAPEILVFKKGLSNPVYSHNFSGSVTDLSMSPDGSLVAVATKGVHANTPGGGGALTLLQVFPRDLSIQGVPSLGETVEIQHRVNPGDRSIILASPALAETPDTTTFNGTLYIEGSSMFRLGSLVTAGSDGIARHTITIPNGNSLIGMSLYYQGINLSRSRKLSNDWIKNIIVPD